MNLKDKYKKLFEGKLRSNDSKLLNEVEGEVNTTGEFDYDYFIKQFESVQEVIEESEYDLLHQDIFH